MREIRLSKGEEEYRTFRIGERVQNRPECNSMYAGQYGHITYIDTSHNHVSLSVNYGNKRRESHPSWVLIQIIPDTLPEDLFTL